MLWTLGGQCPIDFESRTMCPSFLVPSDLSEGFPAVFGMRLGRAWVTHQFVTR
jgi:hypothetical protein